MNIALIGPHLPPDLCGVGDYTARLAIEFAAQGHHPTIWSSRKDAIPIAGASIQVVPAPWNYSTLCDMAKAIASTQPDAVFIQYTPHLFAPRSAGIFPRFPLWLKFLKKNVRCKIAIMMHELHYPVGFTIDRILMGYPQWLQFFAIAHEADEVMFSTDVPFHKYSKRIPWRASHFHWMPVGANIEPQGLHVEKAQNPRALTTPPFTLLQFGSSHPSRLFNHTFTALDAATQSLGKNAVQLKFVGLKPEEVNQQLKRAGRMDLKDQVSGLGYLTPLEVSEWLLKSDLVLAPFIDGVSARRGSVMAALAHGCPILTTRGYMTDTSVPWEQLCAITDPSDIGRFASECTRILNHSPLRNQLGKAGFDGYQTFFAWKNIVKKSIDIIKK